MSWWDTPRGLVLGDGPADIAQSALQDFAVHRRPTLPELLAAMGEALGRPGLLARQEEGPDVPAAAGAADQDLVSALKQAFDEIGKEYRTYLKREPVLAEILETVQFILGYQPERYLSGVEGMEILEILDSVVP
jgi:hypothetical protein